MHLNVPCGLHQVAVFDHHARVTDLERAETMRNHQGCPASHDPLHRFHDQRLGGHINRTCRLVQNENWRVLQESPSQGNALAFTAGQPQTSLAHKRVIAVGKCDNKVMRIGDFRGRHNVLETRSRATIGNIFGDARGEQHRFLHDNGKLVAQLSQLIVAQIDSIKENLAFARVIKAHQQTHEGALTGAGSAGNAQTRPRLNSK